MITREDVATLSPPRDLSLRTPPNWTAIAFFGILSGLHFSIAIPAFLLHRWEGYLSFILAIVFCSAAIAFYFARYELTILAAGKSIRLRSGVGPFRFKRYVPFSDVHAIRLTLGEGGRFSDSRIEILCDSEDIECPQTRIPRQQALFLAILMNVELIKTSGDSPFSDHSDRII